MPRIRIALTEEGNHIKLTGNEHTGDTVLTRRNTIETIVKIYPDGLPPVDDNEPLPCLF